MLASFLFISLSIWKCTLTRQSTIKTTILKELKSIVVRKDLYILKFANYFIRFIKYIN